MKALFSCLFRWLPFVLPVFEEKEDAFYVRNPVRIPSSPFMTGCFPKRGEEGGVGRFLFSRNFPHHIPRSSNSLLRRVWHLFPPVGTTHSSLAGGKGETASLVKLAEMNTAVAHVEVAYAESPAGRCHRFIGVPCIDGLFGHGHTTFRFLSSGGLSAGLRLLYSFDLLPRLIPCRTSFRSKFILFPFAPDILVYQDSAGEGGIVCGDLLFYCIF